MSEPYLKVPYEQTCVRCGRELWAGQNYLLDEWANPVCPVDCMDELHVNLRKRAAEVEKLYPRGSVVPDGLRGTRS